MGIDIIYVIDIIYIDNDESDLSVLIIRATVILKLRRKNHFQIYPRFLRPKAVFSVRLVGESVWHVCVRVGECFPRFRIYGEEADSEVLRRYGLQRALGGILTFRMSELIRNNNFKFGNFKFKLSN
jgi:hypothetical protein